MVGVRHVAQVLLAAQIVEVELRRVGQEELVARRVEDAASAWSGDRDTRRAPRSSSARGTAACRSRSIDPLLDVVLAPRPTTRRTRGKWWTNDGSTFSRSITAGSDRDDATDRPPPSSRSSSRASTRRRRRSGRRGVPPPAGGRRERGHRVHRAHRALGHRQPRRPALVAGAEEVVPGIGDEVVFRARLVRRVVLEDDRLIGHQAQLGDDRAGVARRSTQPRRRRGGRLRDRGCRR